MSTNGDYVQRIKDFYGDQERVSPWIEVSQEAINKFAQATQDPHWLHIDPERAAREGPFEGTIAHGFWTISMLTCFAHQTTPDHYPEGALYGINYGLNRVRLPSPIHVGKRVRGRSQLMDVRHRGAGWYLVTTENRVEVEGQVKPAMVADWLFMIVYPNPNAT